MLSLARSNATPADVAISSSAGSVTFTIKDDDPTVVNLARTGSSTVDEGSTVEFTITLGRSLIAGEIIDVPLIVSGTNITTADWSLAAKTGDDLNTGITLVNETTAAPIVRFSDADADTATLILTAVADNIPEAGGPETLTLALGPNDDTANGFDLNTRMTNVGGGADPASDAANNTFSITINDDMTAPVPDVSPLTAIAEQCELRRADLPVPTATDNQMGTVTVTSNITTFPITSNTTITWTYTDPTGNTATQTQQVTIRDTTPPRIASTLPTVPAQCEVATVTDLTAPTAMDNCDNGTITATTDVTVFPITTSAMITWTYRDATGNTATQTQQVTIRDTTDPVPVTADLPTLEDCSQITSLTAPTAADNCDGTIMGTTTATPPITASTTLTWTYTDAGNNAVTQTQQVIIDDTIDPMPVTADLPTLEDCSQITSLTAPTATDNCEGTIMGITNITPPITASTTLTWTYTDAGNNAVTQTQEVVINSNVLIPDVPSLPTLTDQCRIATLTAPTAMNCSGNTITATTTNLPITTSGMITWTYTDAGNNTVTQTQQVTIDDITDPVPTATDLPTLEDCSQITSLNAPTATDNCDGTITANTNVTPPVTTSTTIMWTYTDAAGNMSTQMQEVRIRDTMNPVPDNTLSALTAIGSLAQTDVTVPTATDNCDGQIMASPDATFPITSTTTITWTYTDAAGNTATQTQQVTITEAPLSAAEDAAEAVIFPNPSGDYLEVRSPVGGTFQLLSLSGKSLLEGTINTKVDITSLRSGLYLVQLSGGRLLRFVRE